MTLSRLPRLSGLMLAAALTLPSLAHATAGRWDTAAAGFNGNGATNATPWITTPEAGALWAEWNVINSMSGATPDIAGAGSLSETTGTAFLTSGGNVYSFAGATAFTATLAAVTPGDWTVYLRVSTLGTSVADTATLNGVSASRSITYTEAITGGFGGGEEESLWVWSGVSTGSAMEFAFSAAGSSMSLDQVALYAVPAPVPEPSTWALMAAGLGALGAITRRRQRG